MHDLIFRNSQYTYKVVLLLFGNTAVVGVYFLGQHLIVKSIYILHFGVLHDV